MRILAIETTCDETAAAVLEDGKRLLSSVVYSQVGRHKVYNGVVPELASRAHCEKIAPVIAEALAPALANPRKGKSPVDAVAFSCGPGLPGGLVVGKVAAETVASLYGVPVIGVNHLEGHLYSCELEGDKVSRPLKFPLVALIISGGHTELWHVRKYGVYRLLGKTRDDAAGEAFDKVAKLLGLAYPGGPAVEKNAAAGAGELRFTKPLLPGTWEFSFSGLKTAVSYYLRDHENADAGKVCAAFQEALISTVVEKALAAAKSCRVGHIAMGGGVAANGTLRARLTGEAAKRGVKVSFVERRHCADNAAMIALCAWRMTRAGAGRNAPINPALGLRNWGR
jgi:N6-L-threonylcarbamoyladenine synthase